MRVGSPYDSWEMKETGGLSVLVTLGASLEVTLFQKSTPAPFSSARKGEQSKYSLSLFELLRNRFAGRLEIHREAGVSFFTFPSEFKWSDRIALALKPDQVSKVAVHDGWGPGVLQQSQTLLSVTRPVGTLQAGGCHPPDAQHGACWHLMLFRSKPLAGVCE